MSNSLRHPSFLRLSLAVAASLLLHVVLALGHMPRPAPKPARMEARLLPPEPKPAPPPTESIDPTLLEKDTLAKEVKEHKPAPVTPPQLKPSPPSHTPQTKPARLPTQTEQRALRKFSEYIIYPQAAVDAGREGTAHLLLTLSADGQILAASIASSSGHADLDQAALAAVRHVGRINAAGKTEFILPFTFRLQ